MLAETVASLTQFCPMPGHVMSPQYLGKLSADFSQSELLFVMIREGAVSWFQLQIKLITIRSFTHSISSWSSLFVNSVFENLSAC